MNKRKNLVSALILQIITMISGLILPRIIISTFGSGTNGLVASITQFLSFISLLEGGLGAVVLAELYLPIEVGDDSSINKILGACQRFFTKLATVFIIYAVVVGIAYGKFKENEFGFWFVFSLTGILSVITLAQYLFSITNKLLLQAEQKVYIVNIVTALTVLLNLFLSIALVKIYPGIHLVKLGSAIAFLIQPVIFNAFIEHKYRSKNRCKTELYDLKNRWDGFAQNLAHFVNLNTDIVVISIFLSLETVSVYTVYLLPITALRSIIASLTNSYQSALGKYYAQGNTNELRARFNSFSCVNLSLTLILFGTCLLLIDPFTKIYTNGISDAIYYEPVFATVIVIANMLYCIREPYRFLILAAGKFKETNFGSIGEALLNLIISISLVRAMGLLGVAIGTLVAISFRFLYFIWYLNKSIIYKNISEYKINFIKICLFVFADVLLRYSIEINLHNIWEFILMGSFVLLIETIIVIVLMRKEVMSLWRILKKG